jgi:hypothetical protein
MKIAFSRSLPVTVVSHTGVASEAWTVKPIWREISPMELQYTPGWFR